MYQQFGNQLDRIHQNSLFNGSSQFDNAQVNQIHQRTMSGNVGHPMSAGYAGGTTMMGGQQNQLARIHQNSLYGGAEQNSSFGQVNQIHQRTMSGNVSNPLGGGMAMMGGQGFNQGFQNQGFQNQATQNQLDRIQQNSLYNGASQYDNPQVSQIQQRTISGNAGNPLGGGFGGGMAMMGGQGFQNQATQNQLDRIHQNSLYGGGEQSANWGQVNQIQQRTISGNESNPLQAGFGMGFGGQGFSSMMGGQGFQNQVTQNQLDRIQQNSLYNGASQYDNAQVGRIHQATMQSGMAQPQAGNYGGGQGAMMGGQGTMMGGQGAMMGGQGTMMGGQGTMMGGQGAMMGGQGTMMGGQGAMMGGGMFRAVMDADAGMTDDAGPSSYPASMYTGHNQYDNVNQAVFNQMNR